MSLALLPSRPQSRAAVHGCRADAVHQRRALAQGGPVRARAQPQRRRGACGCLRPMLGRPAPACSRAWRGPCRPQDRTPGSTIWSTSDGPKPVLNMTLGAAAGRARTDAAWTCPLNAAGTQPRRTRARASAVTSSATCGGARGSGAGRPHRRRRCNHRGPFAGGGFKQAAPSEGGLRQGCGARHAAIT